MLHIVNGGCAVRALRNAGIPGEFLSWDDLLYEGPVPIPEPLAQLSAIRARYIGDAGWESYPEACRRFERRELCLENSINQDEIILWNSFELTDQLQMLQLLHWFSTRRPRTARIRIIFVGDYLAEDAVSVVEDHWGRQQDVTDDQLSAAQNLWTAFCSNSPRELYQLNLCSDRGHGFPFMSQALIRLFQEYPAPGDGLSRTQRQIVDSLLQGPRTPIEIFHYTQSREGRKFMGDWSCWRLLEGLVKAPNPMVVPVGGAWIPFVPAAIQSHAAFYQQRVGITAEGCQVLAGKADAIELNGIDCWIGGVHLLPGKIWRWSDEHGVFQADKP
jgi:hypothetical protein